MTFELVGIQGKLTGKRYALGDEPLTFGRAPENDLVLDTPLVSRLHAELRPEDGAAVLYDLGSRNGTSVNGERADAHRMRPGDEITIGNEVFRFEESAVTAWVPGPVEVPAPLRVTVSGGGPVGLAFALLLDDLMGARATITVHDGRWVADGGRLRWKTPEEGNFRRQQVVTIQSRQFMTLPAEVRERLFTDGDFTEMWPAGPDSVDGHGPRNIRIALVEDRLLELAGESPRIRLVPEVFDAAAADLAGEHVLAICEGGRSATREHFAHRFGAADTSMYSLDGEQVQDMVLGLRVRSGLTDPAAVLLTVAQNRFLLNSLHGEGFLNMRLTTQEATEAVGIDPLRQLFAPCIQTAPCVLERTSGGEFCCIKHQAFFLPAVLKGSAFWGRVQQGLRLFDVAEEDLTAITGFRLDMVARPRFTAQLFPATATAPGTFGFLLGDAANAIHFWPGRGLNSGLASAVSLARCLAARWRGSALRDADFTRHEALMGMLQYRHKSRAWRQMVATDDSGTTRAIKDVIAAGIDEPAPDRAADVAALMDRLRGIRARLASRMDGLPDDAALQARLELLDDATLHTLRVSDAWDTAGVGGEEVDVEWLLAEPEPAAVAVARAA